ncbi:four helix bundle protein [Labilibacter marinus]|uniref:four helix bundle protein n=1 Tax=Labilibacter marinus TaxID=1477105 RepID=UPI00082B957C|nr:four helix bundle protein [Labilibacter marinus]
MGKIEKFEDLHVWQSSIELSATIYQVLKDCKDYGFKDQVCRASVSVPSNIAEGFERQYNKEFVQYLFIAKGSIGEVRTQLILASRLNYIPKQECDILIEQTRKISAQLAKLITVRKEKF